MSILKTMARRARWEVRLALDRALDSFYRIDTAVAGPLPEAHENSRFGDAYVNGPVSYWILRSYIDWKMLRPEDVFYDIGCGDGRVLCVAARHRLKKCIGIELSAEFAGKARANAAALRGRLSEIEVRVGDAADTDYADGTVFYFGDPFGPDTMRSVLKRIGDTLPARSRPLRCIFVLTTAERSEAVGRAIESSGWLHCVGKRSLPYSPMRVEHWAWEPDSGEKGRRAALERDLAPAGSPRGEPGPRPSLRSLGEGRPGTRLMDVHLRIRRRKLYLLAVPSRLV